MYLRFRADPHFRAFGATTPIYAVWDDHDYGLDNSDRTQPGKERSLKTFNEIWPNPKSQAFHSPGIWSRFTVGCTEFFLLDVRYHRSPNKDPDGSAKTMLGLNSLTGSRTRWQTHQRSLSFLYPVAVGTVADRKPGIIHSSMNTILSWPTLGQNASKASFYWVEISTSAK